MKIIEDKSKHKLIVQVLVVITIFDLVLIQVAVVAVVGTFLHVFTGLVGSNRCPRTLDMVLNPGTIVNTEREVVLLKAQLKAWGQGCGKVHLSLLGE